MPSTSQLGANSRSMNGLNNISADTVFTDNLEVNNLIIDVQGTAPTRPPLDNSTKIATTAYVDTAVSAVGGVSLSGNNVFTGNNTYYVNDMKTQFKAKNIDFLILKKGLKVMLTRNIDVNCGLVNGSMGVISNIHEIPIVDFYNGVRMPIDKVTWQMIIDEETC